MVECSTSRTGRGRLPPLRAPWALALLLFLNPLFPLLAQEGSGGQQAHPLQIDDMFKIKRVGSPQVSPDGEWVAYTVSTSSLGPGESGTQIWMVP